MSRVERSLGAGESHAEPGEVAAEREDEGSGVQTAGGRERDGDEAVQRPVLVPAEPQAGVACLQGGGGFEDLGEWEFEDYSYRFL